MNRTPAGWHTVTGMHPALSLPKGLFLCLQKTAAACAMVLAVCSAAQAQAIEPFDHLHLAVSDVEQARDWYIQHMGGNAGETPDAVAWGTWPVDHPLPDPTPLHALG